MKEHAFKFSENIFRLALLDITWSVERTPRTKNICKTVHFVLEPTPFPKLTFFLSREWGDINFELCVRNNENFA